MKALKAKGIRKKVSIAKLFITKPNLKMLSKVPKVVVVGGGAGGSELITLLAKSAAKKANFQPVLVDGRQTHVWKPLLHEVATGALNVGEDELNYFSHGHKCGYDFQRGWMAGLDKSRKVIKLEPIRDNEGKEISAPREVRYDTLVMAVGATTNTFGTPGVMENCICLNTIEDAEILRSRILAQAMSVLMGYSPARKLRIGIVGGGATGVELACEIHHTIDTMRQYSADIFPEKLEMTMTILEGASRILGGGHETLSSYAQNLLAQRKIDVKTNCVIKSVTDKGFILQDGSLLEKDIKVWTAGVKAPDWLKQLGLPVNNINRIKVNDHLQSVNDPSIYALGDCACVPLLDNPSACLPATAQVAHQQAQYFVKMLEAKLDHKPFEPFVFRPQGMLVSLGSETAVGSLIANVGRMKDFSVNVKGRGAKAIYSSLYRKHQAVLHGWMKMMLIWTGDRLRHTAIPQLKLH